MTTETSLSLNDIADVREIALQELEGEKTPDFGSLNEMEQSKPDLGMLNEMENAVVDFGLLDEISSAKTPEFSINELEPSKVVDFGSLQEMEDGITRIPDLALPTEAVAAPVIEIPMLVEEAAPAAEAAPKIDLGKIAAKLGDLIAGKSFAIAMSMERAAGGKLSLATEIEPAMTRLVNALHTNDLYDKYRALDLLTKFKETAGNDNFNQFLDALATEAKNAGATDVTKETITAVFEKFKEDTMMKKEDLAMLAARGTSEKDPKIKAQYEELAKKLQENGNDLNKLSPVEVYLISLLAKHTIRGMEEADARKLLPEIPAAVLEGNAEINTRVQAANAKLERISPELHKQILDVSAKKPEELTNDDKKQIEDLIEKQVKDESLADCAVLFTNEQLKFYIAKKFVNGVLLEDADAAKVYVLIAKYLQGTKLTEDERKVLMGIETDYKSRNQNLEFVFLREKTNETSGMPDLETMLPRQKFDFILRNAKLIKDRLGDNPSDENLQSLADLAALAEQIASNMIAVDAAGNTIPDEFQHLQDLIDEMCVPGVILNLDSIVEKGNKDEIEKVKQIVEVFRTERLDMLQALDERSQTSPLMGVINQELREMADELPEAHMQEPEIQIELSPSRFEIHSSTLASENHPDENQDAILEMTKKQIGGVFDGMGGHANGGAASGMARAVAESYYQSFPDAVTLEQAQKAMENVLLDINRAVYAASQTEKNNMGTAGSMVHVWEGTNGERKAIVGNVGDSRVYVLRNGKLEQITLDDNAVRVSWPNEQEARAVQLRMNNATDLAMLADDRERAIFNIRNQIAQYLGEKPTVAPRIHTFDLLPGDRLILMSDGISDNLTDTEIYNILNQFSNSAEAVKKLTEEAQLRSRDEAHLRHKPDDMTALIMDLSAAANKGGEKTSTVKETKTEELIEQINNLAAQMTDETSYAANINRYLDLSSEYERRVPEGEELLINNPAFANGSPDAMSRFEVDQDKYIEEQAKKAVAEIQEAPAEEKVKETRGLAKILLRSQEIIRKNGKYLGGAIGLAIVATLLGMGVGIGRDELDKRDKTVPLMPPPGAPAQATPQVSQTFGQFDRAVQQAQEQAKKEAEQELKREELRGNHKAGTVQEKPALPFNRENPNEFSLKIGGINAKYPSVGYGTHAIVEQLGKKYKSGSQWRPAESTEYWNALSDANGIARSDDPNMPWKNFNNWSPDKDLKFNAKVLEAAQKLGE